MKNTDISKVEALNDYAQLLIENGFTIIAPKEPSSYFFFSKNNEIGYVQYERITGATFSTVHKPCTECGTGYRISGELAGLNIKNAESALCFSPTWATLKDKAAILKYKDISDFTKQPFHKEDRIFTPKN